jgi:hypothetical protein
MGEDQTSGSHSQSIVVEQIEIESARPPPPAAPPAGCMFKLLEPGQQFDWTQASPYSNHGIEEVGLTDGTERHGLKQGRSAGDGKAIPIEAAHRLRQCLAR